MSAHNHIIRWNYKINCGQIAEKINKQEIITFTENKLIHDNIIYEKTDIKNLTCIPPTYIKAKIKSCYKASSGGFIIIYENDNVYICAKERKVGILF